MSRFIIVPPTGGFMFKYHNNKSQVCWENTVLGVNGKNEFKNIQLPTNRATVPNRLVAIKNRKNE